MAPHTPPASVFGNVHLGYIVIETMKFADWRRFGRDAIGLHLDETLPDLLRFRMDGNECRFLLQRGPAEDVTALGWHIDDHATYDEVLARIARHGVPITEVSKEEAAIRGVDRLIRIPGPNGLRQELYTDARIADAPLRTVNEGGFVTGELGLGHVAIISKKPHEMRGYYDTLFDARLSDYIVETMNGIRGRIRFLRVNERHHSVAIGSAVRLPLNPIRTRVQHLNVQVTSFDDMLGAYQRARALGFRISMSIGQHTNDKELSFYAVTPSGFDWEVGWNPLLVDENTWKPTTHEGISIWGHTTEGQTVLDRLNQLKTGLTSALHTEDTVPALAGSGIPDN